jgi:hypothetical protein
MAQKYAHQAIKHTLDAIMTNAISAADNLVIDLDANSWHLRFANEQYYLASAQSDGFHYSDGFSLTHRLPTTGFLPREQVMQVVLGWQKRDEAWHLGLVLSNELSAPRNSRWCELAHWPDPDREVFDELAKSSGERIAKIMGVPFRFVAPEPIAPPPPLRSLPPLPLNLGFWTLQGAGNHHGTTIHEGELAFVRSSLWYSHVYRRMAWYFFWALVYVGVSVLTLVSPIGLPNAGTLLPNPHILPYLGLATAVGLLLLIVYHANTISSSVQVVRVSPKGISGWHNESSRWEIERVELQSLYISEMIRRREKGNITEHGELNVHLGGGKFRYILQQEVAVNNDDTPLPENFQRPKSDGVEPLVRDDYFTDLQVAGLYVSEVMKIGAWYDLRLK